MNAPPRLMLNKNSKYIMARKIGTPVQLPNTQRSSLSDTVRLTLPRSCTTLWAMRVAKSKRASANKKSNSSPLAASMVRCVAAIPGSCWQVCSANKASPRLMLASVACNWVMACSTLAWYGISKCTVEVLGW